MMLRAAAWLCLPIVAWPQAPVVIKSETKVVAVDVVVTDKKGAYVHDLAAKDFELLEDNKPQAIQSVTLESSASAAADQRTDYIVLVFDYSSMDAGDQIRARQAAVRFADATAGPNHRLAVANLDAGLQIAQSFTGELARVKDAINGSKAADISANSRNNTFIGTSASAELGARAKFQALNRLAQELSAVPGRKTLVLFTSGVTLRSDQKGILADTIEACNRADVAIYPVDLRDLVIPSVATADTPDAVRGGRTTTPIVNPARAAIPAPTNPVTNSRGPNGDADQESNADPNGTNQQVLFALAGGTGGFVIRNAAELPTGLQKIGQEQQEYYLLSYSPPDSKVGSCHALKVKVSRSGTALRARSSYCNGKSTDFTAASTGQDLEKRAAAQSGTIAASMRLPYFYTAANQADLQVILEFPAEAVKFEKKNQTLHADVTILGIASTAGGEIASRFSDTLTLDYDEADSKWKEKPVHYQQELKIAPGQYTLTVAFSAGGENFGKLVQPVAIQPYQPGQFNLSGIALGKEVRKASASSAVSLFEDRKVLTVGANELVPTGSAAFAKSDQAFCYFEAYAASDPMPGASIQLRIVDAKTSQAAWDSGVGQLAIPAGQTSLPVGISLPIASLTPGSYTLEIAAGDGNGHSVRRTEAFEIK